MQTVVEIDRTLLDEARKEAGLGSDREAVEEALRLLLAKARRVAAYEAMRGIGWDGDLDAMREGRRFDPR